MLPRNLLNSIRSAIGFRIFIYDRTNEFPDLSAGIDVPTGTFASIAISRDSFKYMYKPYGNCDRATLALENYDKRDCHTKCYRILRI